MAITSLLALALALAFSTPSLGQEAVVEVTVCQLLADPSTYDHKLIRVSGQVTFAFEEFTLSDTCQSKSSGVWLEYGGTLKTGAIPQGWAPRRDQPLVVEGISTTLIEDSAFQTFNNSIRHPPRAFVTAVLIGRYFAGKENGAHAGIKEWRGFGMWGMFSLLVIQQVISSAPTSGT